MSRQWDLRTRLWGLVYDRTCDDARGAVLEAVRSGLNGPPEPQLASLFRRVCAKVEASGDGGGRRRSLATPAQNKKGDEKRKKSRHTVYRAQKDMVFRRVYESREQVHFNIRFHVWRDMESQLSRRVWIRILSNAFSGITK